MKRIIFIPLTLLSFLFILAGCSQKTSSNNTNPGSTNESKTQTASSTPRNGNMHQPDFGQPDRQADVSGVIKTIVGNEVSILTIDVGSRGAGQETASSTGFGANGNGTTSGNAVRLSLGGTTAGGQGGGGGMPGGADGGGPGGAGGGRFTGGGPGGTAGGAANGQDSATAREQMLARIKAMSTGEEKIIIPVGIKMLKSSASASNNGQPEMIEATLSDLTADKMITVWLNSAVTDKKVAEFVLIN